MHLDTPTVLSGASDDLQLLKAKKHEDRSVFSAGHAAVRPTLSRQLQIQEFRDFSSSLSNIAAEGMVAEEFLADPPPRKRGRPRKNFFTQPRPQMPPTNMVTRSSKSLSPDFKMIKLMCWNIRGWDFFITSFEETMPNS